MTWYKRDVTLSENAEELVVSRHRPRGLSVHLGRILTAVWILAWALAEYETARLLVLALPYKTIPNARLDPEIWAWFVVWTIAGLGVLIGAVLILFAGPEVVRITSNQLIVSTQIGGWTRSWRRSRSAIANLRIEQFGLRKKSYVIKIDHSGRTLAILPSSDLVSTQQVFEALNAWLA